jgi:hypothetical protein
MFPSADLENVIVVPIHETGSQCHPLRSPGQVPSSPSSSVLRRRLQIRIEIFLAFGFWTSASDLNNLPSIPAVLRSAEADTGELDRKEGTIEGDKSGDTRRVAETTAAGASVGSIAGSAAGHAGVGVGVGAAAGAAASLASVLVSRGPDMVLPKGTSIEIVLDRPMRYKPGELGL